MQETIAIVIESEPLDRDDPSTNLICRTKDGSLHRVLSTSAAMVADIPTGWEQVNAIKKIIAGRAREILIEVK